MDATVFYGIIEPSLLEAMQIYARELTRSNLVSLDRQCNRLIRHNDPVLCLLHDKLVPRIAEHLGKAIKKSYVYFASYQEGGILPRHVDRPQCKYTLDLCIEDSNGGYPWPIFVDDKEFVLGSGDSLFYYGCEQFHHRCLKPTGKVANLAFFHFVDVGFEESVD